jgi:hypothetical protein
MLHLISASGQSFLELFTDRDSLPIGRLAIIAALLYDPSAVPFTGLEKPAYIGWQRRVRSALGRSHIQHGPGFGCALIAAGLRPPNAAGVADYDGPPSFRDLSARLTRCAEGFRPAVRPSCRTKTFS